MTTVSVNKARQTKKQKSSDSGDHMEKPYRYHRSKQKFVSNTFFDDNSDSSDGSDYMVKPGFRTKLLSDSSDYMETVAFATVGW